jgi:hypothetical protein
MVDLIDGHGDHEFKRPAKRSLPFLGAFWRWGVAIIPVEQMDTAMGLWKGLCRHPDHEKAWESGSGPAGEAAVALERHWRAMH